MYVSGKAHIGHASSFAGKSDAQAQHNNSSETHESESHSRHNRAPGLSRRLIIILLFTLRSIYWLTAMSLRILLRPNYLHKAQPNRNIRCNELP